MTAALAATSTLSATSRTKPCNRPKNCLAPVVARIAAFCVRRGMALRSSSPQAGQARTSKAATHDQQMSASQTGQT
eukprot:CAMPEP_0170631480 /NCGR_PEP_ID=MMETSP0224-20130122/34669_1 /TAXON_ID=285029 /ORGANISM="Togula jolla, Strain CCCM 725" /LENGTH=75 /DNA_ID=CAMNT_0010959833 /DNA_START=416 /DNA_END=643 /DNA_ORIENTATION=+